jgi:hypothetical protein
MSTIRTYFWHARVRSRWKFYWNRHIRRRALNDFLHGNAGDIFARDLLGHFYPGMTPLNTAEGPRILCIGSIGHRISSGDVVCGIGCKSSDLPRVHADAVSIHALRGPISYDIFKAAGYDVSGVRFLADPGLFIGRMVPDRAPLKGRVVFVPHYRERDAIRGKVPKGVTVIDIDAPPLQLARQLQQAECVYASSLHGIIFAHALGRPCVFVRPATEEPMLKFEDYFLSVGINPPKPLDSISDAKLASSPVSPASLSIDPHQIVFPSLADLQARGIIR